MDWKASALGRDGWTLRKHALNAIDALIAAEIDRAPVCFVSHSLGGLLVKRILRLGKESGSTDHNQLVDNTKAVTFFATPHYGSPLASLARRIPGVSDVVKALAKGENLDDLAKWFEDNAGVDKPKGLALSVKDYYETEKNLWVMVVPSESADSHAGSYAVPLSGDHSGIIDLKDRNFQAFKALTRQFDDALCRTHAKTTGVDPGVGIAHNLIEPPQSAETSGPRSAVDSLTTLSSPTLSCSLDVTQNSHR